MEYTAGNVYKAIDMLAPFGGCMAWDNEGCWWGAGFSGHRHSGDAGCDPGGGSTGTGNADELHRQPPPHYFSPAKAHQRAGCGGAVPGQWHLSHQRAHQLRLCAAGGELRPGANAGDAEYPALWPEDKEKPWYSIIVFVPKSHAEAVYRTMSEAGAGRQGNYSGCAYMNDGKGRFLPEAGAHPYLGKVGGWKRPRRPGWRCCVPRNAWTPL